MDFFTHSEKSCFARKDSYRRNVWKILKYRCPIKFFPNRTLKISSQQSEFRHKPRKIRHKFPYFVTKRRNSSQKVNILSPWQQVITCRLIVFHHELGHYLVLQTSAPIYGQENIYTKLSNLFDEYDYKFHKDKLSLHLITQRDDFSYSSDEYSRIKSCGLTSWIFDNRWFRVIFWINIWNQAIVIRHLSCAWLRCDYVTD